MTAVGWGGTITPRQIRGYVFSEGECYFWLSKNIQNVKNYIKITIFNVKLKMVMISQRKNSISLMKIHIREFDGGAFESSVHLSEMCPLAVGPT